MNENTQTVNHVYQSLESVESVKVEKNSRGFNFEVKAPSVERALQLVDQLSRELTTRQTE